MSSTHNNMTLSEELTWRGLIYQTTFKNIKYIDDNKVTFYHGFDASADSQTIGNLASMMIDLCFLRHGHKAIILAGGATSLVGDAGGRDTERQLQQEETIRHNVECAKKQIQKIYGNFEFTLVNNIDWTKGMDVLEFLRDVGKNFNISEMIKKDIVANRIGEGGTGISYTEFSYSILQAYDFLVLFDRYNCTLQLCGADQWTNCIAGVELIRKKRNKEAHVLTNPLIINKITGKKFGKSEEGAVWLDPEKTSPYDFYQFWINCDDEGSKDYIKIYTEIDKETFEKLEAEAKEDPSKRAIQKYLAFEVTKLVHGESEAQKAKESSEALFGKHVSIDDADITTVTLNKPDTSEFDFVEFITQENFVKSKREARDLIDGKALYLNDILIESYNISTDILLPKNLLRIGKKKYFKIIIK